MMASRDEGGKVGEVRNLSRTHRLFSSFLHLASLYQYAIGCLLLARTVVRFPVRIRKKKIVFTDRE